MTYEATCDWCGERFNSAGGALHVKTPGLSPALELCDACHEPWRVLIERRADGSARWRESRGDA